MGDNKYIPPDPQANLHILDAGLGKSFVDDNELQVRVRLQANKNPELPHFLILDEMNLSHVERYFADFLSVMESNEEIPLYADGIVDNGVPSKLKVPA